MNNIEELFIANAELAAELLQHMADNEIDSDYFAVVTDSPNCGREVQSEHSVTEVALMAAGIIEQLIAQLEASQKELFDFHNQEFQQRLANAEHQLYMKDLAIHNIKASRKAQFRKRLAAEAELSAANEKLKGEQVPVEYQYRYHNHGTGCGEWCRVLTKERYEELQREHAGDNDFVFRMLFTATQKPVALLDKYVRNEKGQYILDGKCEPRIGFAVGWNAAIRAAGGKVEGNANAE
ncbi:TPA: hypothetical protein ACSA7L_004451 [Yersinia enterocolitica]|nr:hypothetical protein [Yersinia enterocolitica]ELI8006564.1 hypothetical protein [Yersinia enterocolitica]ELX2217356.1 hypothetical protein [Yersinia enterocolitica]HEN3507436.1 hypothetical protein [Yersinia enterocolitica]